MAESVGHNSHIHLIPHLEGLDQRREIGRGSFGAVYEVKMNGLPCIAKGLHDILLGRGGNLPISETDKEAIRAKFHNECALLGNLKHPNIVQFLGVHRSKDDDEWLVMEYLHMDLAKCLEMYPDIPLPLKLSILRDVSYGLLHLHSQAPPIIHRDLTAANILLTQGMSAKIADLGVSKIFDIRQLQRSAHTVAPGTWAYMPPEALSPDPKYDAKLDVFSYGVLTLYVANQEFPIVYELQIPPLVYEEIQINKRKPWVDKMGVAHPLYSVVMSCLMDHPDHRPTSKELNDIITKLCTQHEKSCKNVLEVEKERVGVMERCKQLEHQLETLKAQASSGVAQLEDDLRRAQQVNVQLQQRLQEAASLFPRIQLPESQNPRTAGPIREKTPMIRAIQISANGKGLQIYQPDPNILMVDRNKHICWHAIGNENPNFPAPGKVLMFVGATGSGKSTMINGMINYIYGVDWEDDFRYKLIHDEGGRSQTESQTSWITAYVFYKTEYSILPYTLTVIDTPGFGNTRGIQRDKEIADQIKELFSNCENHVVNQLNAIAFVAPASAVRLTATQKYIFDATLSIFGKDIESNILLLATFADGEMPPVYQAAGDANIPYRKAFKFNNSALYSEKASAGNGNDASDDVFLQLFWTMGTKSFATLFNELTAMETRNLYLTREVLKQRDRLEASVKGLQPQFQKGFAKIDVLKQECKVLESHESKENMIAAMEKEMQQLNDVVYDMIDEARVSLKVLKEIALKPNPMTEVEYIDLLIESEKREARPGFMERAKALEEVRKQAILLSKVAKINTKRGWHELFGLLS